MQPFVHLLTYTGFTKNSRGHRAHEFVVERLVVLHFATEAVLQVGLGVIAPGPPIFHRTEPPCVNRDCTKAHRAPQRATKGEFVRPGRQVPLKSLEWLPVHVTLDVHLPGKCLTDVGRKHLNLRRAEALCGQVLRDRYLARILHYGP